MWADYLWCFDVTAGVVADRYEPQIVFGVSHYYLLLDRAPFKHYSEIFVNPAKHVCESPQNHTHTHTHFSGRRGGGRIPMLREGVIVDSAWWQPFVFHSVGHIGRTHLRSPTEFTFRHEWRNQAAVNKLDDWVSSWGKSIFTHPSIFSNKTCGRLISIFSGAVSGSSVMLKNLCSLLAIT